MFTRYKRAEQDKPHALAQRNLLLLALFSQEKSKAAGVAGEGCADTSSPDPLPVAGVRPETGPVPLPKARQF